MIIIYTNFRNNNQILTFFKKIAKYKKTKTLKIHQPTILQFLILIIDYDKIYLIYKQNDAFININISNLFIIFTTFPKTIIQI